MKSPPQPCQDPSASPRLSSPEKQLQKSFRQARARGRSGATKRRQETALPANPQHGKEGLGGVFGKGGLSVNPAGRGKAASVPDDAESPCAPGSPPSSAPQLPQGKGGVLPLCRGAARALPGFLLGPTRGAEPPLTFWGWEHCYQGVPVLLEGPCPLRIPIPPQAPIPSNLRSVHPGLCCSKTTPSPQFPHSP